MESDGPADRQRLGGELSASVRPAPVLSVRIKTRSKAPKEPHQCYQRVKRQRQNLLIIGASRGLGHALAAEYLKKGWKVVGTVRAGRARTMLRDLVPATGLIGLMSSGQGSIANNETGMRDVYRGSKAARNMVMRSFAARHADSPRAMVLMAPGWVRTDLGGPHARLSIEDSVPNLVNVLLSKRGTPGLQYLDCLGRTVPW